MAFSRAASQHTGSIGLACLTKGLTFFRIMRLMYGNLKVIVVHGPIPRECVSGADGCAAPFLYRIEGSGARVKLEKGLSPAEIAVSI